MFEHVCRLFDDNLLVKSHKNMLLAFRRRMLGEEESEAELVKDLSFLAYHHADIAKFIANGWKFTDETRGNINSIIYPDREPQKMTASVESPEQAFLVRFLGKKYGITHLDHLVHGVDINDELQEENNNEQ